jgi:hypothetical protein
LRWIAEETSLRLNTVRTIVGKINETDQTTKKQSAHRNRPATSSSLEAPPGAPAMLCPSRLSAW